MNIIVPSLVVCITLVGMFSLLIDIFITSRKNRIDQLNKELNIKPTYSFTISAYDKDKD